MVKPRDQVTGKAEWAYRKLRKQIVDRSLKPGQPLSEQRLALQLGTSRTPVRQALQALEREGLVRIYRGRGAFVSDISVPDILDVYQMREALETHAYRLAARSVDRVPVVDSLAQSLQAAKDDLLSEESESYYSLISEMDQAIVKLAGNRRLAQALDEVWAQIHRFRHMASADFGRLRESVEEHLLVLRFVSEGREEEAADAAREHIRRGLTHILESMSRKPKIPVHNPPEAVSE